MSLIKRKIIHLITLNVFITSMLGCGASAYRHELANDSARLEYKPPLAQEWRLENGLSVLFLPDSELPIVSGTLYLRGGSYWAPENKLGVVEVMGSLMRQGGAGALSADQLDKFLEQKSAAITGAYGEEFGVFSFECLKSDFASVGPVFSDVIHKPRFDHDRLTLWRGMSLESLRRRKDDPATVAGIAFSQALFGGTPYGVVLGEKDIKAIQRSDLITVHEEFVKPDGGYLVLTGDLTKQEAQSYAESYFASWQSRGHDFPPAPLIETTVSPAIYFISQPVEQSTVFMGQRGVSRLTEDYLAIDGFNKIFGSSGFSSRLMKRIRSDLGLVYGISGEIAPALVQGKNGIALQTKAETTGSAIIESLAILKSMQQGPILASEMQAMKSTSVNSFVFKFDSVEKLAQRYAMLKLLSYPDDYDQRYIPGITALSDKDIQQVANKRWNRDQFVYIVVGNETAYDSVRKAQQIPDSPLASLRLIRADFSDRMLLPVQ
jgi:zinc protease